MIKLKRLRWAGYVAIMRDRRGAYRVLVGKHERRGHLKDRGVDGRIIKGIFKKWGGGYGLDRCCSG